MFTGIVQAVGLVQLVQPHAAGARLRIDPRGWDCRPRQGDSIAVNGCCLTYAPRNDDPPGTLGFDVIRQTLAVTSLERLKAGSRVNLESCVTPTTPMGGHFMQGHIDAIGTVRKVASSPQEHRLTIEAPAEQMPCIVPRGSIAVEGVSLTLADVDAASRCFEVALIPTTLQCTTLGDLRVGDSVNLETDILARTVIHYLNHYAKS